MMYCTRCIRFCFAIVILATVLLPRAEALEIAPYKYLVGKKAPGAFIPFASNHTLTQPNRQITRILFSIHSSGFDALQYYENARIAASKVPGVLPETLIIAPQFFEKKVIPGTIPNGMLYWRVSPYRGSARGAVGSDAHKVSISAFEVLDNWLTEVTRSNRLPRLKEIVIVGHSAGGQFVQRYAMIGKFEPTGRVKCRYVVSAPSSYAYPSAERFDPQTNRFAIPAKRIVAACPKYNNWGYGLDKPYVYFANLDAETIAQRYAKRSVFYLCGSKDANPNDDTLGKSCGAMLQGRHRLERMRIFAAYLEYMYGKVIASRHMFAIVAGVGHYGRGTMTSPQGLKFLFAPIR